METGDVFEWVTTKALGHETRRKFHVFICEGDWADDDLFLFVCSVEYMGDFPITTAECPFLSYDSFISCSYPVFYTAMELAGFNPKKIGRLPPEVIRKLAVHVADSETLEHRHIVKIYTALTAATS
jgi:hypothetical protein